MLSAHTVCLHDTPYTSLKNLPVQSEDQKIPLFNAGCLCLEVYTLSSPLLTLPARRRRHFRSFSFTFIHYPWAPSDKAKRVFQNDCKARQVSKNITFYCTWLWNVFSCIPLQNDLNSECWKLGVYSWVSLKVLKPRERKSSEGYFWSYCPPLTLVNHRFYMSLLCWPYGLKPQVNYESSEKNFV